jgi:L-amino acid N-acyltransferase YncA
MSTQPAAASIAIRACEAGDVAAITTIYAHHVPHGLASFEIEPPSENDMRQRRLDLVGRDFPYLVAECAGEVVGYAYASPYRLRPAYPTAAVGAARKLRSERLVANRGRYRRQRELHLDWPA